MLIARCHGPNTSTCSSSGIAEKLDLAYAGPQSVRIAQLVEDGTVTHRGHPHLRRAVRADVHRPHPGRGAALRRPRPTVTATSTPVPTPRTPRPSPRPPPSATAWCSCRSTRSSRRSRFPAGGHSRWMGRSSWSAADRPFALEPLFTRDPRHIGDVEILKAMIAIRGVYERHQVRLAQPRGRVRHRGDRIASADLRRTTGPEGQDRQALDAESAPDTDPGDRVRLGGVDPLLRRRSRGWSATPPPGRTCSSPVGRVAAFQSGAVPARRPVRDRHVHRLIAADRRRGELVHRHRWAAVRVSAARPTWATTRTVAGTPRPRG